jgi:hypothetical protein
VNATLPPTLGKNILVKSSLSRERPLPKRFHEEETFISQRRERAGQEGEEVESCRRRTKLKHEFEPLVMPLPQGQLSRGGVAARRGGDGAASPEFAYKKTPAQKSGRKTEWS